MTTEDNSTGYGNLGDLDPEARGEILEFRSQFFEQKSKGGIEDTIGSTREGVKLSFNILARLLAEQEAREDGKDKEDVSETDINHTLEPLYEYYDKGMLSDEEVRDWMRELAKELGYDEEDDLDIAA